MLLSLVSPSVLHELPTRIKALGGNASHVFDAAKRSGKLPKTGLESVPLEMFFRLLNEAALETNVSLFGLEYGSMFRRKDLGYIAYLFTYNLTLRESFVEFGKYFPSLQTNSHFDLRLDAGEARIEYEAPGDDPQFKAQDAEFSMLVQIRLAQFSLGSNWQPKRMEFQHQPLATPEEYRQYLPCDISFGKETNRIFLSRRDLNQRNSSADPKLAGLIRKALAAECKAINLNKDEVTLIRQCISDAIIVGEHLNFALIAEKTSVSAIKISHVLREHGTNFREILIEEKMKAAKSMLRDTHATVHQTAEHLGYSETSSFSRAFRNFTGMSPKTFRNMNSSS